jgi:hypothetical protein
MYHSYVICILNDIYYHLQMQARSATMIGIAGVSGSLSTCSREVLCAGNQMSSVGVSLCVLEA